MMTPAHTRSQPLCLDVFFTRFAASRQAGTEIQRRIYARTEDPDTATTWATREAQ